ncbi:hypothetical protein [Paraburkholderia sp. J8-2]|uniref:hypothetical protein n=1 Tax=Paraburkholderia sp. J8-2 TaxID=2805440 RepID=UPI002AB5F491|nr:hypothetical protein [Paraburkholderia sp. J8-2]
MNCLIQTIVIIATVTLAYRAITPARARRFNEAVHPFFVRLREYFEGERSREHGAVDVAAAPAQQ